MQAEIKIVLIWILTLMKIHILSISTIQLSVELDLPSQISFFFYGGSTQFNDRHRTELLLV